MTTPRVYSRPNTPYVSLPTNNQPAQKRLRTKPSETESYRLLKAYLRIQSPDGQIISGLFALDTHSNVTYIREQYSLARTPHPHENAFIHGAHTTRANRNFRSLLVLRHGHIFKLDVRSSWISSRARTPATGAGFGCPELLAEWLKLSSENQTKTKTKETRRNQKKRGEWPGERETE